MLIVKVKKNYRKHQLIISYDKKICIYYLKAYKIKLLQYLSLNKDYLININLDSDA